MFKTFILKNIVHFLLRERLETVPAPAEDFSGTAVGGIGVLPSLPYCSTDDCFEMDLWPDVRFLLNLNILVLRFVLLAMFCRQTLNVIIQQVTGDGSSTGFYLLKRFVCIIVYY